MNLVLDLKQKKSAFNSKVNSIVSFGIRGRILSSLVGVAALCLTAYAYSSMTAFIKDKEAFVFETVASNSSFKTQMLKSELSQQLGSLKSAIVAYDPATGAMNEFGKFLIEKNLAITDFIILKQGEAGWVTDFKYQRGSSYFEKYKAQIEERSQKLTPQSPQILELESEGFWLLVQDRKESISKNIRFYVRFMSDSILARMTDEGAVASFITLADGSLMFVPNNKDIKITQTDSWQKLIRTFASGNASQKTGIITIDNNKYLYSAEKTNSFSLIVVTLIANSDAFGFVTSVLIQSILVVGLLICVIVFISVYLAKSISAPIEGLADATLRVSEGDFDVNIETNGNDEISQLGQSFNTMTQKVKDLLIDTSTKARMENELKTAQIVQKTLFPVRKLETSLFRLQGYYQSASECGGDWWFYFQDKHFLHILIGDVTGHGAAAALMTAAARAAVGELSMKAGVTPLEGIKSLNRILSEISQGQIMMTFQWLRINTLNGECDIVNAAHESFIWVKSDGAELEVFDVPISSRLGENPEKVFSSQKFMMSPGDRIFFVTDGLSDIPLRNGRQGLKSLVSTLKTAIKSEESVIDTFSIYVDQFRETQELPDDVTFIYFEYLSKT